MTYSPYQNGKCEVWWNAVERRLMAMLEGVEPLTLDALNHATIAWLERDYHRRVHRELATTPLKRLLNSDDASRPCPDASALRAAFRIPIKRTVRRSDATRLGRGCALPGAEAVAPLARAQLARRALGPFASVDLVDGAKRRAPEHPLPARQAPQCPGAAPTHRTGRTTITEQAPLPLHNNRRRCSSASSTNRPASGLPALWLAHPHSPAPDTDDEHGER